MDETELLRMLNERYGSSYRPEGRLILQKEKLFHYSGTGTKLPYKWMGSHIAHTDLTLTIEGAQQLGTTATRNVLTVTPQQATSYYDGEELEGFEGAGAVILRTPDLVIGPGLLEGGKVRNILPKSRRTKI